MNYDKLIGSLTEFPGILRAAVVGLRDTEACWKPPSGNWSILEIVRHLGDEEVDDFRTRVTMTLADPSQQWPPIDPEAWARERDYNNDDFEEALSRFVSERQTSLNTLADIDEPNWNNTYHHPKFGEFRAGDLFAAWCAHDYLHLRQVTKRRFEMMQLFAGEFETRYAGDWTA